ncbi:MAG TPA: sulfurtransferase TusA family protein [Candidatus Methanoperedens sp.]|nr:sulfurtransferase TusA family protein [Candidatus Methanoperedens sp.]
MQTIEFDIRGQICPSTLLIALREMNTHEQALRAGGVRLRFLTDNRDCVTTIPESAHNMGFAAEVARRDGCYLIELHGG